MIAATGKITTVAGDDVSGYAGDGTLATAAELSSPEGVAVDTAGNLFIADTANNRVREVSAATGLITTVAGTGAAGDSGNGTAATAALLDLPTGFGGGAQPGACSSRIRAATRFAQLISLAE